MGILDGKSIGLDSVSTIRKWNRIHESLRWQRLTYRMLAKMFAFMTNEADSLFHWLLFSLSGIDQKWSSACQKPSNHEKALEPFIGGLVFMATPFTRLVILPRRTSSVR